MIKNIAKLLKKYINNNMEFNSDKKISKPKFGGDNTIVKIVQKNKNEEDNDNDNDDDEEFKISSIKTPKNQNKKKLNLEMDSQFKLKIEKQEKNENNPKKFSNNSIYKNINNI